MRHLSQAALRAAEASHERLLQAHVLTRLGDAYREKGEFRIARDMHSRHLLLQ
ncbi:hypothetical protein T484DRAFT_1820212, partial [Baffinella frigidus]